MKFVFNGYTYDDVFLQKLNDSLNDICAFSYNKFLNAKFNDFCIMDAIYLLERNVPYDNACPKEIGTKKLTLKQQISLVVEFFSMFGFDSVESILNGNNPLYKINFTQKEKTSGSVGHSNYNEFLEFDFEYNETVHSASILAHEVGHALSNHHLETVNLAKLTNKVESELGKDSKEFKDQRQIFRDFCDSKQKFNKDCVGEIESHISEKLFMHFLKEKGVISEQQFNDYITYQNNSLKHNLVLMIEENEILSHVNNSITEQDCIYLYEKFKNSSHLNQLLDRIRRMAERKTNPKRSEQRAHSEYRFRYVVGEIVSSVWYNKYITASKQNKKKLIDLYKKYLKSTDACTLENCCSLLLGEDYTPESTIMEYLGLFSTQSVDL